MDIHCICVSTPVLSWLAFLPCFCRASLSNEEIERYMEGLVCHVFGYKDTSSLPSNWHSILLRDKEEKFRILSPATKHLNRDIPDAELSNICTVSDALSFFQAPRPVETARGDPMKDVFVERAPCEIPQNVQTQVWMDATKRRQRAIRDLKQKFLRDVLMSKEDQISDKI